MFLEQYGCLSDKIATSRDYSLTMKGIFHNTSIQKDEVADEVLSERL